MNLLFFLVTYFPATTGSRPFSADHEQVIQRIENCVLHGGRESKAIYRGFAKTSIAENAAIWAVAHGHRKFVALFGATADSADDSMESIKRELETNDLLDEDFPEITQSIRALEGKSQRCASQTCDGEQTFVEWTSDKIALPCIKKSKCAGAVITSKGLTAASRGLKHKSPTGVGQRPDFAIVDDPQTDESAGSPAQVQKRLNIIRKVILQLSGHRRDIACTVNGTIIEKDDVMDQLTDPKLNPAFQSQRIRMVKAMPTALETLWLDEYARIRNTYDSGIISDQGRAHRAATEFYLANREKMDAGAEVSWEECYKEGKEVSALQHAMNILIDDGPAVFGSECQGEPVSLFGAEEAPTAKGIANAVNRLNRGMIPKWATKLVCFVDVQKKVLYYLVLALADDFTAAVVDYGYEPDQAREYFSLSEVRKTLEAQLKAAGKTGGVEAAIWLGLDNLTTRLLSSAWRREDGAELRIERCLVDSGFWTELIYEFCRRSPFGAVLMPSKGKGLKAGDKPFIEYQTKPHERPGFHYLVTSDAEKRVVRLITFDTNFFKTFFANRTKTLGRGALSVWGDRPEKHQILTDHCASEWCVKTMGRGRTVWEWKKPRPGHDNHLLDCVTGCYAAGALQGCRLEEFGPQKQARQRRKLNIVF